MTLVKYPSKSEWNDLCRRPVIDQSSLEPLVAGIMQNVSKNGDKAIFEYNLEFDKVKQSALEVTDEEFQAVEQMVPVELQDAIKVARDNIEKFHKNQFVKEQKVETTDGVTCWRKRVPIDSVGLYIPGGTAPLFSTVLMLGIPAVLAGCRGIILCTPPNGNNEIHPAILYTAKLIGIENIYKVGGAQAIAAMTYGTETINPVNKIFGPGNQFVTMAKQLATKEGIAIDMPAGPSEVLVIADKHCKPEFVAADLLSQAEHGSDSQVILLSDDEKTIKDIQDQVGEQLNNLPRKSIAERALENSRFILLESLQECIDFSNYYAPEHLILAISEDEAYAEKITNAGSVFLGNYTPESLGDYASGTNHTLPTNGYAKNYSGVSLDSFLKTITFQKATERGIQNVGPTVEIMAEHESLNAHKKAVTLRLEQIKRDHV